MVVQSEIDSRGGRNIDRAVACCVVAMAVESLSLFVVSEFGANLVVGRKAELMS